MDLAVRIVQNVSELVGISWKKWETELVGVLEHLDYFPALYIHGMKYLI